MRRLGTVRLQLRRRLADERGAVAVIVATAMVALLGFTAVALDLGALYAERAQLQNGADAAALALAQDCAESPCTSVEAIAAATNTAGEYANENSNDNASNIATPTFPTSTSVHVMTTTRDGETDAGALAFVFAPLLGIDAATVQAEATASWGSPASGPAVLPLAFSPCSFKLDGAIQAISPRDYGSTVSNDPACPVRSPSNKVLPGGFGWLADPSTNCNVDVDIAVDMPMRSNPGASGPAACAPVLRAHVGQTVLLPVFEDTGGEGSNGWYKIRGWAAFTLLGWNFPSIGRYANQSYSGAHCKGSCKGIIGKFVSFVSFDDRFTTGGPSLGSSVVTLTK